MSQRSRHLLFFYLVGFVSFAAGKPPPSSAKPWMSFIPKPVYSRSLGPPSITGMDTISVPYMPKPSLIPKFVDPKMMISKKTELLNNLFGGLGPVKFTPFGSYTAYGDDTSGSKSMGMTQGGFQGSSSLDGTMGMLNKRGVLGPKLSPMAAKFNPFALPSYSSQYDGSSGFPTYQRKRRSIDAMSSINSLNSDSNKPSVTNLGPPPPYPGLSTIPEEPETEIYASQLKSAVPMEYLPGMFSPFAPVPAVDPAASMISKKSAFLDNLFKTLAVTTPPTTDTPIPKSTIVPPSFWIPSSVIPGPTEYTGKVSVFLNKLFDGLKLKNATSMPGSVSSVDASSSATRIARSIEDLSSIAAAKDAIVDSILSELSDLKGGMLTTLNDMIAYQKSMAMPTSPATGKKLPKPFASIWAKPPVDTSLPFQQRMAVLGQVFDMLTELQKNITTAVDNAVKSSSMPSSDNVMNPQPVASNNPFVPGTYYSPMNLTILDAIKQKLADMEMTPDVYSKAVRSSPMSESPLWIAEENLPSKRQISEDEANDFIDDEQQQQQHHDRKPYARGVQMKMHQGYQSLPAGSVESVQAGGGSVPGHQGGGIKLLGKMDSEEDFTKWADWTKYINSEDENQNQRHHHNHH